MPAGSISRIGARGKIITRKQQEVCKMPRGVNKVTLVGNLGKDPETRYTQDGNAVCNFSVATSEEWRDKNTGEKREKTEWHRIVTFRKLAEICSEYLVKGQQVYIQGKLQTRSWEADGVTKYTTEIVADEMLMLGGGKGQGQKGDSGGGQAPPGDPAPSPGSNDFDDDIPF